MMASNLLMYWSATVALLAEGVDRNEIEFEFLGKNKVALLAEGVDRNQRRRRHPLRRRPRRPPRGGRG